jgi:adenosine kinase
MTVLISGSLAYDRILDFQGRFADHILPDKIHKLNVSFFSPQMEESFGGTAGNIAYNLKLLDEPPAILARGGSDFEDYKRWLEKNNISTETIEMDSGIKTAVATILTDETNNQIAAFYPGAMLESYKKPLPEGRFGIVAAGNPEDMKGMPALFKERHIPYLYDPAQGIPILSGEDLKAGMTGAEAVISNDYELSLIKEKTGWDEAEILKHTKTLITTLGEKGSRIMTASETIDIATAEAESADDPTGAGDAYRAGFIAGYLREFSLKTCGQLGALVACYTVERHGTQTHRFSLPELRERYQKNFKETINL